MKCTRLNIAGDDDGSQYNSRQAVGGQPRRHGYSRRGFGRRVRGAPQVPAVRVLQQRRPAQGHRRHQGSAGRPAVRAARSLGHPRRSRARDLRLRRQHRLQDRQVRSGLGTSPRAR